LHDLPLLVPWRDAECPISLLLHGRAKLTGCRTKIEHRRCAILTKINIATGRFGIVEMATDLGDA
jgi:hypothetical protein